MFKIGESKIRNASCRVSFFSNILRPSNVFQTLPFSGSSLDFEKLSREVSNVN